MLPATIDTGYDNDRSECRWRGLWQPVTIRTSSEVTLLRLGGIGPTVAGILLAVPSSLDRRLTSLSGGA